MIRKVAVTGLNAIDNPGPGVPVARSLRDAGYQVVGLAYETLEPGIYMKDLLSEVYTIPYPSSGSSALLSRLGAIKAKSGIECIIPNFDAELSGFISISNSLSSIGIKTFLPDQSSFSQREKWNLSDLCQRCGIDTPLTVSVNNIEEVKKYFAGNSKCVVKGKYYGAKVCHNLSDVVGTFDKFTSIWGLPVIMQKYIEGEEFNLVGMGDGEGGLLAAVAMRKTFVTDKGKAWSGVSIKNEELTEMALKFVRNTNWRGGFELEVIKSSDGRLNLIEVNPRLPAWTYLSASCGVNIPDMIVRMADGQTVEPVLNYTVGKMFVRCSWDLIVDESDFAKFSITGERH